MKKSKMVNDSLGSLKALTAYASVLAPCVPAVYYFGFFHTFQTGRSFQVGLRVAIRGEDKLTSIAALCDVVRDTNGNHAGKTSHAPQNRGPLRRKQENVPSVREFPRVSRVSSHNSEMLKRLSALIFIAVLVSWFAILSVYLARRMPWRYFAFSYLLMGGLIALEVGMRKAYASKIKDRPRLGKIIELLLGLIIFISSYLFAVYVFPG